jgi:uncharacterized flavoprotein (TIGR03862 family)
MQVNPSLPASPADRQIGDLVEDLDIVIIGAGPAGLMAAERLGAAGRQVTLFDRMATPGRKFLMAGRGGLNLTHSEPSSSFLKRYGPEEARFRQFLRSFSSGDLREWADSLGAETFVGSSGRIFPRAMKASGLLRAWLARLRQHKVSLHLQHRWLGWDGDALLFQTGKTSYRRVRAKATILALGGASWPKLGSDGAWQVWLGHRGVTIRELVASNCGVDIAWSTYFREHFAGQPLKAVAVDIAGERRRGEVMLTSYGLEGSPIYALSPVIRDGVRKDGHVGLKLDLKPDLTAEQLVQRLATRHHGQSFSQFLKKSLHLPAPSYALLREAQASEADDALPEDPFTLAHRLKALPLSITAMRPVEEAISSAGGIAFDALDDNLMLRAVPGVFACGEMLDWEAPTGGYLLQGCFATAVAAAAGVEQFLKA